MPLATVYRKEIEAELRIVCDDIVKVIEDCLLPSSLSLESRAYYLKLKGDYCRYVAEFETGAAQKEAAELARAAYSNGIQEARFGGPNSCGLGAIHPTYLGLALNYAVFHNDIDKDAVKACALASEVLPETRPFVIFHNITLEKAILHNSLHIRSVR